VTPRAAFSALLFLVCLGAVAACHTADAPAPAAPGAPAAAPKLAALKAYPTNSIDRWDYVTIDPDSRHAYIACSNRVVVVDIDRGIVFGDINDLSGVHGVALDPKDNLGFVSNGKDNSVSVFGLTTLKVIRKIKVGLNPDAILYDPASARVFVCNGRSGDISIINPAALDTDPVTLPIGGKLEFAVADGAGHVYVNVEDKNETVAIDSKARKVLARWPLAPGEGPSGLAIDPANHRLFVGCDKLMVILDAGTGRVVTTAPTGDGVDGVAFDSGLAVSANGRDGTATVVQEDPAGKFNVVQTVPTIKTARTLAADPKTHRFFLPHKMVGGPDDGKVGLLVVGTP
jgi:YVTN family beta-propeller protein